MKTEPMAHQIVARHRLQANPDYYALACEQGTGKTWMLLDDIERQYRDGKINAALVLAPNGVHINWVRREIPAHMDVPVETGYWKSGMGKRAMRQLERLLEAEEDELVIVTMNIEAINAKGGYDFAMRLLKRRRCWMGIDESRRIKDPTAKRTQRAITLGEFAETRRIASGTMITNGPLDAFGQFQFLQNGLLGTTSYRAFVSEYAELVPASSRVVQHAAGNMRGGARFHPWAGGSMPVNPSKTVDVEYVDGQREYFTPAAEVNWQLVSGWRAARTPPQIIARGADGAPRYRNLDRLRDVIAPYTYRVMKADCLDLPPKVYENRYFELTPALKRLYQQVEGDMRYEYDDGEVDTYTALTLIGKLRQIASGYINRDGEPVLLPVTDNPRLQLMRDLLDDLGGQFIIWASQREEIRHIAGLLKEKGISHVEYHGGIKQAARDEAIDAFQGGTARCFLGTPAAGGTGLTLTAASTAVFYSESFDLEARLQAEDRNHRKGTEGDRILYIDLVGVDTVDERIAASHQTKSGTAKEILDF